MQQEQGTGRAVLSVMKTIIYFHIRGWFLPFSLLEAYPYHRHGACWRMKSIEMKPKKKGPGISPCFSVREHMPYTTTQVKPKYKFIKIHMSIPLLPLSELKYGLFLTFKRALKFLICSRFLGECLNFYEECVYYERYMFCSMQGW